MGADHVIQVQKGQTPRDLAAEVVKVMGVQPNVTLETSGAQASLQTAIHVRYSISYLHKNKLWYISINPCTYGYY